MKTSMLRPCGLGFGTFGIKTVSQVDGEAYTVNVVD